MDRIRDTKLKNCNFECTPIFNDYNKRNVHEKRLENK